MASELASFESDLNGFRQQLETCVTNLQSDPGNEGFLDLKKTLDITIAEYESIIEELKPAIAQEQAQGPSSPPAKEKWSKENHPAYRDGYRKPAAPQSLVEEAAIPTTYKVNDTVMAKWVSGDKAFYSAKITLITGSSSAPKYHVKFIGYNSTDVVQGSDIKPQSNESKKRKADGIPVTQTATPVSGNSNVISAAASIDPMLASQVRKEPSKVSDGPPKPAKVPRKVKANKELEAGKSKWMDFMQKGPKTTATKKESMFRTPDGVNARVGFTGSGAPMRKDPNRGRHIYQAGGEDN